MFFKFIHKNYADFFYYIQGIIIDYLSFLGWELLKLYKYRINLMMNTWKLVT